jgi:hypothetical protein
MLFDSYYQIFFIYGAQIAYIYWSVKLLCMYKLEY